MGEHVLGVNGRWGGMLSREKGTLEGFWGVADDLTKFPSPPGERTFTFYGKGVDNMLYKGGWGR
jgi:hypothetical protein